MPYRIKYKTIARCLPMAVLFLISATFSVFSKPTTKARINNVDFEFVNGKIIINYDIDSAAPDEEFNVWIEVYNIKRNLVKANTLSGDVNKIIRGGKKKIIIWDIIKDYPVLNEEISIEVFAVKHVSLSKMLFLSGIYPGLGIYKTGGQKKSLIPGAAGYTLLLSSALMQGLAYYNYDRYRLETNPEIREKYYRNANNMRNISSTVALSGLTLWVVNLAFTCYDIQQYKNSIRKKTTVTFSYENVLNNEKPVLMAGISFHLK